jgi:hypothetical protein
VAITAHGSSYLTYDLDICYSRTKENLKRIVAALKPYYPRLRDMLEGLPFFWDETTLRNGTNFTFSTDLGDIDLLGEVKGVGTYEGALASSIVIPLYGLEIRFLSIDALIESKRAAARPKDLAILPELEALREELQTTEE